MTEEQVATIIKELTFIGYALLGLCWIQAIGCCINAMKR